MFDWTKAFGVGLKIIGAINALLKGEPVNESFELTVSGHRFVVGISVAPVVASQVAGAKSLLLTVKRA